jgi:chromosome partitioning protein
VPETPFALRQPSPVEAVAEKNRRREQTRAKADATRIRNHRLRADDLVRRVGAEPPCPPAPDAQKNGCYTGEQDDKDGMCYTGKQASGDPDSHDRYTVEQSPFPGRGAMPIITLLNLKGGVGKTSTTHHLAGSFAKAGMRCLVVDNDPQASLTMGLFGPEVTRAIDPEESVSALYSPGLSAIPEVLIKPTGFDRISIIPGSESLTPYNITPASEWPRSERGLADLLEEVRDDYDVCLIDCPPNLHLCSWAALVASDYIIIPLQCEDYGSMGLGPVQRSVQAVQAGPNPALHNLGYLLTMYDKRLGIHSAYETMLRQMYGAAVFTAPFPLAKDYKEAVAARQPISHYKPKSAAAKAAKAVADELLHRVAMVEQARAERSVA